MADDNTKKAEGQNADDESTDKSKKPNLSGEKSEKDDKKKADDGKSKTDDDDASDDAEDDPKKSAKFSQDDLDRIIKKRLKEEKDKQTREAEEAKAREKGEFEKLSNQFKTERDDLSAKLEALTEKHTKLTERVSQLVAARLKGLPEMIAALKPETDDADQMLDWLLKAEKQASKLKGGKKEDAADDQQGKKKVPGNGGDPKAKQTGDGNQQPDQDLRDRLTGSGNYAF